jgi:membrane protein implicated in regulation of membrane protease activity
MDSLLNSLGLTLLYLALLGIGVVYAIIILVGGALHDIHLPGVDLHVGGHEIGPVHVEVGADAGQPEVNVPSLSPVTIASFVTAFGGFGLIAIGVFNVSTQWSLAWAAGGGLIVAVIAHFAFGYFLIAPQGSSEVRLRDIVGAVAEVTTPIPSSSVGEVAFVAQGGRMTYTAKSATGAPIARGTTVMIEKVVGGVAVVRPQD